MKNLQKALRAVNRLGLVASFMLASGGSIAAEEDKSGWSAQGTITVKGGSERHIGELDLFLPLYQDNDSLFYSDLRVQTDDDGNQEGNAGFGYRRMGEEWILGGYGFFDYRNSGETGNRFMQGTLGLEAMTEALDLRANFYIPEGKEETTVDATTLGLVGGSLQLQTLVGKERALPGLDGEAGYRLWASQSGESEIRAVAGGYYFSADNYRTVAGPRGRVEVRLFGLGLLGEGARFTLGAEITHDRVRDTQGFAVAQLTIPLGGGRRSSRGGLDRRMTDYVVRDVDIVTSAAVTSTTENVAYVDTGVAVGALWELSGADDVVASVADGGAGDLFVLDGSGANFTATETIALGYGQVLLGGGSSVEVIGLESGTLATFTAAGARPAVASDVSAPVGGGLAHTLTLADDTMVVGLDIDNISTADFTTAIYGSGATGVHLIDNDVTTGGSLNSNFGIYLTGSPGSRIIDNIITTSGSRGVGLYLRSGSDNGTVIGNNIATTGDFSDGLLVITSSNVTITDNNIETSGWRSYGLQISGNSTNNTVTGNDITTSGLSADGMYVLFTSSSSFDGNSITTYGSQSRGIFLRDAYSNTFNNNTIATSLTDVSGFYLRDYSTVYNTEGNTGNGNIYTGPGADCYVDPSVTWTNSIDLCL